MNYYNAWRELPEKEKNKKRRRTSYLSVVFMRCCGMGEAFVEGFRQYRPRYAHNSDAALEGTIVQALTNNKSVLVWSIPIRPLPFWKEIHEKLPKLPQTVSVGSFINANTGNRLHIYVTFLRKDW